MPATRSKKGKKSKAAAAAPPVSVPAVEPIPLPELEPEPKVEHKTVDDSPMQTDQPDSTSLVETAANIVASAEATVVNSAEVVVEMVEDVVKTASEFVEETTMEGVEENSQSISDVPVDSEKETASKLTLEERKAKLDELRKKMAASSRANRSSLVEEAAKAKITARDAARLERQRKLAEMLRTKADAEERGEDVERQKNWEYTIEENEEWEKKLARKKRRADFEFHDDAHAARRRYKKDLDIVKPDLAAYNQQKAIAMGQAGNLVGFNPTGGSSEIAVTSEQQRLAAENLYRDANTLIYGDSKPSEDAIDRVVSKINKDIDKKGKFSRKRLNEEEGDITYINEHNRVFNKKIARYYDKYTAEIRASFERGTAL